MTNSAVQEHYQKKAAYVNQLKSAFQKLIILKNGHSFGVYEKMRDVVPPQSRKDKFEQLIQQLASQGQKFTDTELVPSEESLQFIKTENMKYVSWYRVDEYYGGEEYQLFQKFKIADQVMRNMGYSHICDALNTLSSQPGLIVRLFESSQISPQSCYQIWINQSGEWREIIIDDFIPIFCPEDKTKAQFYFSGPSNQAQNREIWYLLLEKALAKSYGSYKGLYAGTEAQILRDLTGAPVSDHPIVHIDKLQKITEREAQHINTFWTKLSKNLKKGYAISAKPRNPSSLEAKRNVLLNVFNKKYFLGDGIYSSHSYSVLAARGVQDKEGSAAYLIMLRTPWVNEKWTGAWGVNKEEFWTEKLKKELNYYPEQEGFGEFWMPIRDFMHYFEALTVVKTIPGNVFNSVRLKFPTKRYPRAAVRFSCPKKGKYTIAIDQQDSRIFGIQGLKNLPVKLSLCKLEQGEFQLLSHTSSNTLRTTSIRKLIEKGEYYVLVEIENTQIIPENDQNGSPSPRPVGVFNLSIYGPESCGIKVIECEEIHIIYDFLLYEGWNSYACQRIGNHIQDFKVSMADGSSASLGIYLLAVPSTIIYALKNINDFGLDIHMEIVAMTNKEILGPEGKVSFNQHFKIDAGKTDIFILRDSEKLEPENGSNLTFKIKSVVGSVYEGVKPKGKNVTKVYEFLFYDVPEQNLCIVSKIPELRMAGLYDSQGNQIVGKDEEKEIKIKRKSVIEAAKFEVDAALLEDDDQEIFDAIKNAGLSGVQQEGQIKYKLKTPDGQTAGEDYHLKNASKSEEQYASNQFLEPDRERKLEKLRDINQKVEEEKSRRKRGNETNQNRAKSSLQFKEQPELLQTDEKRQSKSVARPKKSILKNKTEEQEKTDEVLKYERQQALEMDDLEIAKLLSLTKEEVLTIPNPKLLRLIQYTGIDAFVSLYGANHEYLEQLYKKLGTEDISTETLQQNSGNIYEEDQRYQSGVQAQNQYYADEYPDSALQYQDEHINQQDINRNQNHPQEEYFQEDDDTEAPIQEIRPSRMSPEDGLNDTPTMEISGRPQLEIQSTGVHYIPSKNPEIKLQPNQNLKEEKSKVQPKRELDMEVFGYQLNLTGTRQNSQPGDQVEKQSDPNLEHVKNLSSEQPVASRHRQESSQNDYGNNKETASQSAQKHAPFNFYTESYRGDPNMERLYDSKHQNGSERIEQHGTVQIVPDTQAQLGQIQIPRDINQKRYLEYYDDQRGLMDRQMQITGEDTPHARLYGSYNQPSAQKNFDSNNRLPVTQNIVENVYTHSQGDQQLLKNLNSQLAQANPGNYVKKMQNQSLHHTHPNLQNSNQAHNSAAPSLTRYIGSYVENRETTTPMRSIPNNPEEFGMNQAGYGTQNLAHLDSTPTQMGRNHSQSYSNLQPSNQPIQNPSSIQNYFSNIGIEHQQDNGESSQSIPRPNSKPYRGSQNSRQLTTPQHVGKYPRQSFQRNINPEQSYHYQQALSLASPILMTPSHQTLLQNQQNQSSRLAQAIGVDNYYSQNNYTQSLQDNNFNFQEFEKSAGLLASQYESKKASFQPSSLQTNSFNPNEFNSAMYKTQENTRLIAHYDEKGIKERDPFWQQNHDRLRRQNAAENQRSRSNILSNLHTQQIGNPLRHNLSPNRNILEDEMFLKQQANPPPVSGEQVYSHQNPEQKSLTPVQDRSGRDFQIREGFDQDWDTDEGVSKINKMPNLTQGPFINSASNLHDPLRFGFNNRDKTREKTNSKANSNAYISSNQTSLRGNHVPDYFSKRQSERFNSREVTGEYQNQEYLNLRNHLSSNANIPSSSFYNSNDLRHMNDNKDFAKNQVEKERRNSQANQQRVDKLSRGSMDKTKAPEPTQNRANQRTDYNQLFDNIMGGSNRQTREKNLGLLGKGFMPNKSKGSIGANMFRDRSMENISQNLGIKRDSRPPGKNTGFGDTEKGITPKEKPQSFFSQKSDAQRRKAYQLDQQQNFVSQSQFQMITIPKHLS